MVTNPAISECHEGLLNSAEPGTAFEPSSADSMQTALIAFENRGRREADGAQAVRREAIASNRTRAIAVWFTVSFDKGFSDHGLRKGPRLPSA